MGGLQEAIGKVTAENSPGADTQTLDFITRYIQQSPAKGSDKALKYLKKRFELRHVKVQNLTLIVLDTCQKKCGHMFRERVPSSDLFADLIKVATLKRKVDVQIYNKVLALIEDWAEALDLPSYKQAHHQLKMGSVQFPNRVGRDLSEYQTGGMHDGYNQVMDAGGKMAPGSPSAGTRGQPYSYGGNGHFVPPQSGAKPKTQPGNDGGLPENMLAPGQSSKKLQEDLTAARNSVDLLAQMLAPITLTDPSAVKQDLLKELAVRCEDMLPKLATLAEEVTDEHNLDQTLVVHADMEEAVTKYHSLLQAAEGKTPTAPLQKPSLSEKLAAKSAASKPVSQQAPAPAAALASKKEINLLDWDDEPASSPQHQTDSSAPAGPVPSAGTSASFTAAAVPVTKATDFNSLMSLFDAPQQPLQSNASEPVGQLHGPPSSGGFRRPDFDGPGGFDQPSFDPSGPASGFHRPNFGPPGAGNNVGGRYGQPNFQGPPSAGPPGGNGFNDFNSFGPPSFSPPPFSPQLQLQAAGSGHPPTNAGWQGGIPGQQANPFGGEGGAGGPSAPLHPPGGTHMGNPPGRAASTVSNSSIADPQNHSSQGRQPNSGSGAHEGSGPFGGASTFPSMPQGQPQHEPQSQQSQFGGGGSGSQQGSTMQPGFGGFTDGPAFATGAPQQHGAPQQQQQQKPQGDLGWAQGFGQGDGSGGPQQWNSAQLPQQVAAGGPPHQQQQQQPTMESGFVSGDRNAFPGKADSGSFPHSDNPATHYDGGLIAAVKGPSSVAGSVGSANPFDDPPEPVKPPPGGAKLQPSKLGAAPKPSWSPTVSAEDDPFSSIGPSFSALKPAKA